MANPGSDQGNWAGFIGVASHHPRGNGVANWMGAGQLQRSRFLGPTHAHVPRSLRYASVTEPQVPARSLYGPSK